MEKWKPSNGSEADYMWSYCDLCERDRATWPKDQGGEERMGDGCPILAEMGMNGEHDAWIIDENGYPKCVKFIEEGEEIPEEDTETLDLFTDVT